MGLLLKGMTGSIQCNMYSSNSVGKLDVFENAMSEFSGKITILNK